MKKCLNKLEMILLELQYIINLSSECNVFHHFIPHKSLGY